MYYGINIKKNTKYESEILSILNKMHLSFRFTQNGLSIIDYNKKVAIIYNFTKEIQSLRE